MILTIITFIVVLGLLIFVHELGHFVAAKRLGVKVEEFGFGFPPRLFGFQRFYGQKLEKIAEKEKIELVLTDYKVNGDTEVIKETVSDKIQEIDQLKMTKKWHFFLGNHLPSEQENLKGGTIYSVNWLPLGGFVKIKGEQGDKSNEEDSFTHKKIWKRTTILASGVLMNFLLTVVVLTIGFFIGFPSVINNDLKDAKIKDKKIQVVSVLPNSPAEKADLQIGDTIIAINNQPFKTIEELQQYNKLKLNEEVTVKIERERNVQEKKVVLASLDDSQEAKMGTGLVVTGIISYPWYQAIWQGLKTSVYLVGQIFLAFYDLIKNLIISQEISADLTGPVGIAVLTGKVAHLGFIYLLQFIALLSINLAIINIFPFPALDGGRILFLFIEKIRGRAVNQKIESLIHNIGFFLLIGLVLTITLRDVSRFRESILGFIKHLIG